MQVYLHIPFCGRRCSYCDFAIAVRRETPSTAFAEAIEREWRLRQEVWSGASALDTVYLGGGTPSRLEPAALARVLNTLRADLPFRPGAEVTLEANPEDVTAERAAAWIACGINRVSLGAQSFDPDVLTWMHREHSADRIGEAVRTLRAAGCDNLSLDLIYGLPDTTDRDWRRDLNLALGLEPHHLSLYGLTIESGTPLWRWQHRGEARGQSAPEGRVVEEYLQAHEVLASHGYEHYEVSNAARPGYRGVHNSGYWARRPYLGLGPSAHSAFERERAWNIREWEPYRRAIRAGQDPRAGSETLTDRQALLEHLYLGLRTLEGVPQHLVPEGDRTRWVAEGWARVERGTIVLRPEGWLRLDALVASLPELSLDLSHADA
jgi:oxygen-independent coproporphyrinogen-3 oxidase